jgi:hypothetical protein
VLPRECGNPECKVIFTPEEGEDPRKAFCSETCKLRARYLRHQKKILARAAKYYKDHKPEIAAKRKAPAERALRSAKRRIHRQKHAEVFNAKQRQKYGEKQKKLAEADRILALASRRTKPKGEPGRPRNERARAMAISFRNDGKSWARVTMDVNAALGLKLTAGAYRYLVSTPAGKA